MRKDYGTLYHYGEKFMILFSFMGKMYGSFLPLCQKLMVLFKFMVLLFHYQEIYCNLYNYRKSHCIFLLKLF